jgi:hypothetical protein
MTTPRTEHTATLLGNGKVLIAGGWDGFHSLSTAELYDPSTRTFAPTGSMSTPRQATSATLLANGRVLIAGGYGDPVANVNTPILTAEIYDPSLGTFTKTGDLNSIGGAVSSLVPGNATALLPDGRVFVTAANNAEIYDPRSGSFSLTGPYLVPSPLLPDTATWLPNGKVLFTAWSNNGIAVQLFDPQTGTFGVTGPMASTYSPDYGYASASLTDGRVFFLGSDEFAGADVEVYDPTAGTFTSIASWIASQEDVPAARLADGTVLIAGGQLPGGFGSSAAQLFVPASGTIEYAGAMNVGRHSNAATPLPDNTVLITGGFSVWTWPNPQPTASAEVYKPR